MGTLFEKNCIKTRFVPGIMLTETGFFGGSVIESNHITLREFQEMSIIYPVREGDCFGGKQK